MKTRLREEQSEPKSRSCLCQCMEPILCSCYSCMVWLLAKVFLTVFMLFLIYFGFLTILQRREPGEAFSMAIKDLVNMFYPSDPARRPY
ncbi:AGAP011574-PA-like protein [Anopheles sinensis]|uniref:AGAP011574-PA-like protein n=1 Tax=Anopheles sinensis TaxID=74873 RepID=A0A084VYW7_ANOSI|nr:AGAP011574-PA-like protein [Anopheles sinensis]